MWWPSVEDNHAAQALSQERGKSNPNNVSRTIGPEVFIIDPRQNYGSVWACDICNISYLYDTYQDLQMSQVIA